MLRFAQLFSDKPAWLDQVSAPSHKQCMKIVDKYSCLDRRFSDKINNSNGFILVLNHDRLELHKNGRQDCIWVDFTQGQLRYRRLHGKKPMLARAIGIKQGNRPSVLDCTGGLGRDGFLMASAGCEVTILERNKIVAALLADGLRRAEKHPDTANVINKIKLLEYDAIAYIEAMAATGKKFDVVYLDPMFPVRSKSAKVKKELQFLQQLLITDNDDSATLFTASLKVAGNRIVVKRPKNAASIGTFSPTHKLAGKTTRFDVYTNLQFLPNCR